MPGIIGRRANRTVTLNSPGVTVRTRTIPFGNCWCGYTSATRTSNVVYTVCAAKTCCAPHGHKLCKFSVPLSAPPTNVRSKIITTSTDRYFTPNPTCSVRPIMPGRRPVRVGTQSVFEFSPRTLKSFLIDFRFPLFSDFYGQNPCKTLGISRVYVCSNKNEL